MSRAAPSFPYLRAFLATSIAAAVALGIGLFAAFLGMVAMNGLSERDALPVFAILGTLAAAGTAALVALANLLALGRGAGGSLRWGASAGLGALAGGGQLFVTLVLLALF